MPSCPYCRSDIGWNNHIVQCKDCGALMHKQCHVESFDQCQACMAFASPDEEPTLIKQKRERLISIRSDLVVDAILLFWVSIGFLVLNYGTGQLNPDEAFIGILTFSVLMAATRAPLYYDYLVTSRPLIEWRKLELEAALEEWEKRKRRVENPGTLEYGEEPSSLPKHKA